MQDVVRPGDTLMLFVPEELSAKERSDLSAQIVALLSEVNVVVVDCVTAQPLIFRPEETAKVRPAGDALAFLREVRDSVAKAQAALADRELDDYARVARAVAHLSGVVSGIDAVLRGES